jgi:hypothetical protein
MASQRLSLEELISLGTLNAWARADAGNGTGAGMFAAFSTVRLALECGRYLTADTSEEERTSHAKREFHEALAAFIMQTSFQKATKGRQKVCFDCPCAAATGYV